MQDELHFEQAFKGGNGGNGRSTRKVAIPEEWQYMLSRMESDFVDEKWDGARW